LKRPTELSVPVDAVDGVGGAVTAAVYPADEQAKAALILAHGAGADQRSRFMVEFARGLAALGIDAVTFNFPYMEQRRRIPDRRPVLEACYRAVVAAVRRDVGSARSALFIGGKSMGGRIATHVAASDAELPLAGLVLLGYPLHPPGRPRERRDAHLGTIGRPMLFVQGSRDAFGTPWELEPILAALSPPASLHVVVGGDHSFKVPKGVASQARVHTEIQQTIADWMGAHR
jgi:predicted alpha/beta-hydrolase family hydrolase